MRRIYERRPVLGLLLEAELLVLDHGVQATLWGGSLSHVGSVTIAAPDGTVRTFVIPNHKDHLVGERWAETIAARLNVWASVTCGIHYDNLSAEGIDTVIQESSKLLGQLLQRL